MPPEYRNESSCGSPTTIRAPSRERITSSTACRIGVPGAIVSTAASRFGSRRGSSSDGVRVKPRSLRRSGFVVSFGSFGIESRFDGLAQRFRLGDPNLAMRGRAARNHDGFEPELRALLEAPLSLSRLAQAAGEADLAECRCRGA